MIKKVFHILFLIAISTTVVGCALYPVVQVAGGAMTGYDAAIMADEYLPRTSIEGSGRCIDQDKMLERRLRERLHMNGLTVSAHVINANAYLVGPIQDRNHADYAIDTASTVQGLKTITCKFYHPLTARQANRDKRLYSELATRIKDTKRLEQADLRIEVINTNAILIGKTDDFRQKAEALAIASEVGELSEIIDYISVVEPLPGPPADSHTVAKK